MEDRRRAARIESRAVVNWGPVRSTALTEDCTRNLSKGGLCLVTLRPPQVNDRLDIEIQWPHKGAAHALGLVKWVRPAESVATAEFDVGVEFLEFVQSQSGQYQSRRFYELATRIWQTAVCSVALVCISPLFLFMAVVSRIVNGGHVLYRGERVGRDRKIFVIYKLRTLKTNAESEIGGRLFDHQADERYYLPLGHFLRRTKLDELPQLLNVIKGDMNLVGPRPTRPVFLQQCIRNIPGYELRFAVRPGITGSAQLRGHYYTCERNKLRYDLIYIRNRSVLLDLSIILRTAVKVFKVWANLAKNVFLSPSPQCLSDDPCIGPMKNAGVTEGIDRREVE
jgi:lipopolysaccharide/colanic/teichoic acid biosynthesis glycosyltransferase